MFSKVYSAVTKGLSGQLVEIETMANKGLRSFNIVGLADQAIDEAKERVNAAIKSIGLNPPHSQTQKVIVNLAPADLKKEGTLYDLPIALGFLLATEQVKFSTQKILFAGELSLDGRLKAIPGTLTLTFLAKNQGFTKVILPQSNTAEASLINLLNEKNNPQIIGANNLKEVIDYLEERLIIEPAVFQNNLPEDNYTNFEIDFSSIGGQTHSKRGLEIAASGNHNLLLEGPPGTGKTLLAKAMISILPKPEPEEIIEITKIYSLAGLLDPHKPVFSHRPFRSPHHTASESALLGGGPNAKPGEITLAHRGVLFLDEFPEFHRDVLESLRQPLEQRTIFIQRAKQNLAYPANFILIAAANPCPCGYYKHPEKECSCTGSQVASYKRKLSGPLLDRIDIFCWAGSVTYEDLNRVHNPTASSEIKIKVQKARDLQKQRFKNENFLTNSEMHDSHLKKYCQLDPASNALLKDLVDTGQLSARGYHRVLKVARTIADLDENENITAKNLTEALSYRKRENN